MKTFNCISKVTTTSEMGESPFWVEFEVTKNLCERLEEIKFCCTEHDIESATIDIKPLHWDKEQLLHIEDVALEVRNRNFCFIGLYGGQQISSIPIKIGHLVDIFDNQDMCLYEPTHEFCWYEKTLFVADSANHLDTFKFIENWIAEELS